MLYAFIEMNIGEMRWNFKWSQETHVERDDVTRRKQTLKSILLRVRTWNPVILLYAVIISDVKINTAFNYFLVWAQVSVVGESLKCFLLVVKLQYPMALQTWNSSVTSTLTHTGFVQWNETFTYWAHTPIHSTLAHSLYSRFHWFSKQDTVRLLQKVNPKCSCVHVYTCIHQDLDILLSLLIICALLPDLNWTEKRTNCFWLWISIARWTRRLLDILFANDTE